jgi:F0F1-type ATP synthase membrane subunit c/vacuolar-type H+-ATPase subunit K
MADSLNTVSSALESTSRNSAASADVLRTMRDNLASHDNELESLLQRQASRFTTMLATAILLSVMAVMAVVVLGYLMLHAGK